MKRVVALSALTLALGACGYDGSYRYECQDPANWEEDYCNPPVCLVDGMCSENLIGFDPSEYKEETPDTAPVTPVETTVAPTEETTAP